MSFTPDELTTDRKPSKLVPFALLALGSAAIVAPFLLRRAQARATVNELAHAPPPRTSQAIGARRVTEPYPRTPNEERAPDPEALDPLYALKAFGIATCVVGASALASVGAVRWSFGVRNTEEFAERMRAEVRSLAPVLSARIHRPLTPADSPPQEVPDARSQWDEEEWTWSDAARRLSNAYEEGGMPRWIEAAGRELELEARVERRRRGHR